MTSSLDIVILSHNVKDLLLGCVQSIYDNGGTENPWNIIVIDNASTDDSVKSIKNKFPKVKVVESEINTGFSAGNNMAKKYCTAPYVLFLNPDTKIKGNVIQKCLEVLVTKSDFGATGCKVMLPDGRLDYSCHRGLPTLLNTFTYWSGLSRLFPKSKFLSGYKATYLNTNNSHEIDCISGTFLLIKRELLDKIGWWDTDYFWNGEDIEMCYQIKKNNSKIWYEASEQIIHFKGSSSGLWKTAAKAVAKETSLATAGHAAHAMRIFMNKHKKELGPPFLTGIALWGITLLEKYRLFKLKTGLKYA